MNENNQEAPTITCSADLPPLEHLRLNPSVQAELGLTVRLRAEQPRSRFFRQETDSVLFEVLARLVLAETPAEARAAYRDIRNLAPHQLHQLVEAGLLVTEEQIPQLVWYACPLGLESPALFPENIGQREVTVDPGHYGAFQLNPRMYWQHSPRLPQEIAEKMRFHNRFSIQTPVLWVREPVYGMLWPYWPTAEFQPVLSGLLAGTLQPGKLSPSMFQRLCQVGVLLPGTLEDFEQAWADQVEKARMQLEEQEYTVIRELINPVQLSALRQYLRGLQQEGYLFEQDTDTVRRHYLHNEVTFRYVHHQMTAVIQQILTEEIKPSYCYLSYYNESGIKRHTDRSQCAWNCSVALDANPEPAAGNEWPICFETRQGPVEVRLALGDGVLYRGTETPHWRPDLPPDHQATTGAFHFVLLDFQGSLD